MDQMQMQLMQAEVAKVIGLLQAANVLINDLSRDASEALPVVLGQALALAKEIDNDLDAVNQPNRVQAQFEAEVAKARFDEARDAAVVELLDHFAPHGDRYDPSHDQALLNEIRATVVEMRSATAPDDLLARITAFCTAAGMSKAEFGKRALKDPAFVYDLEQGRDIRRSTADRVVAFMAQNGGR